jgi:hypothetical protein
MNELEVIARCVICFEEIGYPAELAIEDPDGGYLSLYPCVECTDSWPDDQPTWWEDEDE